MREIVPADQVGMKLEPTDQRIAFAVFDIIGLGEAAQAGAQPVTVALSDAGKNSYPCDTCGIGHALDEVGEQRFHIRKSPKDPREPQHRHRRSLALREIDVPRVVRKGSEVRLTAKLTILEQEAEML